MLERELGQAILIESLSFMVEDYYSSWKDSVSIYLALTDLNELSDTFELNYSIGTRQLVLEVDTLFYGTVPEEWFTIELQTPFWYPGERNLLLELVSPGADGGYTDIYNWNSNSARALISNDCSQSTGSLDSWVPYMILTGSLGLDQRTFASIKVIAGSH
ncbi:MAG: hypothetical protein KAR44_04250 [Candidatus Aegiribacteria sp.]|nr:hypothetical protein [Candidatus Aegiribacteria sp.]